MCASLLRFRHIALPLREAKQQQARNNTVDKLKYARNFLFAHLCLSVPMHHREKKRVVVRNEIKTSQL